VTIVRGGVETISGAFGLPLYAGDEVRTGEAAEAEIHFENGTWIQVGPKSTMQVKSGRTEEGASRFNIGERSFEVVRNFLKLKDTEGTTSLAPLRSLEKDVEIVAVSPCLTKVRTDRPLFRWKTSNTLQELKLTVYDEDGVHWHETLHGETSARYPDDAPPLEAGRTYSWTVETIDPLTFPPIRSKAAFFEILSSDDERDLTGALDRIERERLPSKSTYHLMRASLFFTNGLMEEAIAETQRSIDVEPDNATLRSILARLYAESGRPEEALSAYDRLIEEKR
jgi:tetratricopeptide (TPR) repeat protein